MRVTRVTVEEDKNIIIIKCRVEPDHSRENTVVIDKIDESEEEIQDWNNDGRCNLQGKQNLSVALSPCRRTDSSISTQRLHLNFIFVASPATVHNRVLESLREI